MFKWIQRRNCNVVLAVWIASRLGDGLFTPRRCPNEPPTVEIFLGLVRHGRLRPNRTSHRRTGEWFPSAAIRRAAGGGTSIRNKAVKK
jgi:hypothetical protein